MFLFNILALSTYLITTSVTIQASMSGLDLETMKLLLADQSKSLISELKAQVKTEVKVSTYRTFFNKFQYLDISAFTSVMFNC